MEWIVLIAVAALAALYILLPWAAKDSPNDRADELRAERGGLLALLRELDEDAAAGRISPEDRLEGRRALGPRLRAVTEALREMGEHTDVPPAGPPPTEASAHEEMAEPPPRVEEPAPVEHRS